jgi:hypothetical protein
MHCHYRDICDKCGHKVKVFTQFPKNFEKKIGNPDAMIIFTNTVSHKMVSVATNEAKRKDIPIFRCHTSSGVALERTIQELEENLN